ncbi:MAG: hypothetical protein KatS3mg087_1535 [Patescibacteria group bacterium]|nr:MAG: hypothetical protein KatS3mg087_1535 [Patescibacteria group bacterium]
MEQEKTFYSSPSLLNLVLHRDESLNALSGRPIPYAVYMFQRDADGYVMNYYDLCYPDKLVQDLYRRLVLLGFLVGAYATRALFNVLEISCYVSENGRNIVVEFLLDSDEMDRDLNFLLRDMTQRVFNLHSLDSVLFRFLGDEDESRRKVYVHRCEIQPTRSIDEWIQFFNLVTTPSWVDLVEDFDSDVDKG